MEVHHHPDLHHKKKKFKEYFFEFLMIFLAVTLGFIAESLREHISNHSKEKEYISGFIRNMETDTVRLRQVINFDSVQIKGIDSFLLLAHVNLADNKNRKLFYQAARYFFNSATFKSNDATLQQLKSTGDYRLIQKDHVADSLTKYDADVNDIYNQGDYYKSYFREILDLLNQVTDMTVFGDKAFFNNGLITGKQLPLFTDEKALALLFNKVFTFKIITYSYAEYDLKPQLQNATRLISYLRKEYNIND